MASRSSATCPSVKFTGYVEQPKRCRTPATMLTRPARRSPGFQTSGRHPVPPCPDDPSGAPCSSHRSNPRPLRWRDDKSMCFSGRSGPCTSHRVSESSSTCVWPTWTCGADLASIESTTRTKEGQPHAHSRSTMRLTSLLAAHGRSRTVLNTWHGRPSRLKPVHPCGSWQPTASCAPATPWRSSTRRQLTWAVTTHCPTAQAKTWSRPNTKSASGSVRELPQRGGAAAGCITRGPLHHVGGHRPGWPGTRGRLARRRCPSPGRTGGRAPERFDNSAADRSACEDHQCGGCGQPLITSSRLREGLTVDEIRPRN